MRKITGNKKGIDTILAALLMVVIVVVASVMVYAWSTGLLGALMGNGTGNIGKDAITMEFNGFNTNFNLTMNLRNQGTASVTLASYYVKDSNGNQWSRSNWQTDTAPNHPLAIPAGQLGVVFILLGGSGPCNTSSCSYTGTGSGFAYTTGNTYYVTIITARGTQFQFTTVQR